jgi:hypothetical protein
MTNLLHLYGVAADDRSLRAEGMNIPLLAIHAVSNGERAVEALVI